MVKICGAVSVAMSLLPHPTPRSQIPNAAAARPTTRAASLGQKQKHLCRNRVWGGGRMKDVAHKL